jgi:integrase
MAWIQKRTTRKDGVRYDVGYRAPDGSRHKYTFRVRKDATTFKRAIEVELAAGAWMDPNLGNQSFGVYATNWLRTRAWLSPKTRETYESQLRTHILPGLGDVSVNRLTPAQIRAWHAGLFEKAEASKDGRPGPNTIAKCYRLVHAILETAMDDEILRRNPCRIRRAGREEHRERPIASIGGVFALAEVVAPPRRALVLLAAFSGLRLSELLALRRRHVDVLHVD